MYIALIAVMYAVWSSAFALAKDTLAHSSPLFLTATRMLLGGGLLLPYLLIFDKASLRLDRKTMLPICALGFFSVYLTNILEYWGLGHLSASVTCFLYSLCPFFSALFSYIHFKEQMNGWKWVGLAIGFCGFVPVMIKQGSLDNAFAAWGVLSWPALAVMGAALCSVYGWVLLRLLVKQQAFSPLAANGYSMGIGGLMALVHSLLVDSWAPLPVAPDHYPSFLHGLLLLTAISNVLCYNLYGFLLKRFTATFLSFMGLLSPLFASFNAWLLLGEPPSALVCGCTVVVAAGLWIVYRTELQQGYILASSPPPPIAQGGKGS